MSLLYKRPNSPFWYVTKTRKSTGTSNRKHAEEFARKALQALWREDKLGEALHTWEELVSDWLDRKEDMASLVQDRMVIERFSELLARREITYLRDITADVFADYAKTTKALSSASTANRHNTTLRAMMNRAASKEPPWIDRAPTIENYNVKKVEPKWLPIDRVTTILPHLPEWVADMLVIGCQTGLRYSNIAEMEWSWVSEDNSVVIVPAMGTKNEETYTIPLSKIAREIVAKLRLKASDQKYVFVGKKRIRGSGKPEYVDCAPVPTVRYWWESARDAAGFPGLKWHQATRHSWTSAHVKMGTPDRIVMKLGGWSSPRMLQNYAHLATKDLAQYVDNVNAEE